MVVWCFVRDKNRDEVSLPLKTRTRMEVSDLVDKYPIYYNV
ncbi:hypothetical protein [Candidatus Hodgkinia cicadicola]